MKHLRNLTFILILPLILNSCVGAAMVGGGASGVALARDKSLVSTKDDIWINSKIIKEFSSKNFQGKGTSVDVIVYEGRVLLTGVAKNSKDVKKAVDLCWKIAGVKEVIDEIQVIKNRSSVKKTFDYVSDATITTRVETELLFLKEVSSLNYKSTTFNGVVYLIGTGKDDVEIQKVVNLISKIIGVKKVISHVVLKGDKIK